MERGGGKAWYKNSGKGDDPHAGLMYQVIADDGPRGRTFVTASYFIASARVTLCLASASEPPFVLDSYGA